MLHRRIVRQLISPPQRHVSSTMLKLFCVGCKQRDRLFSSSRRHFQEKANDGDSMDTDLRYNAQILWDYLRIDSPMKKCDVILVLGNSDLRTAEYAAQLYRDGYAPLVVVSGKEGHGTRGKWSKPEAVVFADKLLENSVPSEHILLEPRATNTGENVRFTQKLLRDHPHFLHPQSVILIQTPFMGRRCMATFLKQWEGAEKMEVLVSSPPIPLNQYPEPGAGYTSMRDVVREMVRNLHRIQHYPSQGFQLPQHVPSQVLQAFRFLQAYLKDTECSES